MLKDRNNVSVADSINEALVLSMKKNKNVLLIGLGVDDQRCFWYDYKH